MVKGYCPTEASGHRVARVDFVGQHGSLNSDTCHTPAEVPKRSAFDGRETKIVLDVTIEGLSLSPSSTGANVFGR